MSAFVLQNGWLAAPHEITERTEFPKPDELPEVLRFDLSNLRSINSYGIRGLIHFVRSLGDRRLEYHNCPPAFIETINVVRELLGPDKDPTAIHSLAIPHYCEDCDKFVDIMVNREILDLDKDDFGVGEKSCPSCSRPMIIDCDEDEYLGWLD